MSAPYLPEREYLTPVEVSELLELSPKTVHRFALNGVLAGCIRVRQQFRIPQAAVTDFELGRPSTPAAHATKRSFTVFELAARWRVSARTVEREIRAGALRSYVQNGSRRIRARSVALYESGDEV